MQTYKSLLKIALPAMAENLLQMLMGVIDTYLISAVGLVAVSGVAVANNLLAIYQALFIALGASVSALVAKNIRKDKQQQAYHAAEALKLTLLLGVVSGLFSLIFGRYLLALLGTEAAVVKAGGTYLAWVGGTSVLLGLMTTLGALLRATGRPQTPMYLSLLTNLLNALFSAFGVYVFHAGVVGVALGTVIARLIGVLLLASKLRLPLSRPSWRFDRQLLTLALPTAGERLMMRAGDVVVISLIVQLGTAVVAGNAIGETLTQFNYMPGLGVATATLIAVAQAEPRDLSCQVRTAYRLALMLMVPLAAMVFLLSGPLTALYTIDPVAASAARLVALYSFLGAPATAGTLIYTAVWQGLGQSKLPFYATSIGMWLVRILVGWVLVAGLGFGLSGVWLATILDNLWRWGFLYYRFKRIENTFI